ncbi:MFS transporter [Dactylosporangium darangshiense]|uniref:MFS transporter n=1 Tax=Dactylosporangium darangshiense TaxID=579108 RepID=A0ABP8D8J0_9ACTN
MLRERNARLYLTGVLVSGFGDSAMSLAAGVWVKTLTGSDALAGVVGAGMWLALLLGPVLGGVADRVERRRLLVTVHLALAVVLAALASGRVWVIFAGLTLVGAGSVLAGAAEAAILPSVLPGELRGDFNGLVRTVAEGMKLFGPAAGAGLFALLGGPAVALLDAATFAAAAIAFALLRPRPAAPPEPSPRPSARPRESGFGVIRRDRTLRALVLAGGAALVASSLSSSATFAVLDEGLHRPPAFAGVLTPAQGLGSIACGLLAGSLMRRLGERGFAALGLALFAIGAACRAAPWTWLVLAGCVFIGLGLPAPLIAAVTALQRLAPGHLLGRASATADTLMFAPAGPALLLGGLAVSALDYRVQIAAAAALAGCAALALARRPAPALSPALRSSAAPR